MAIGQNHSQNQNPVEMTTYLIAVGGPFLVPSRHNHYGSTSAEKVREIMKGDTCPCLPFVGMKRIYIGCYCTLHS